MNQDSNEKMDLEAIRRKLDSANGPELWRSLEEVADEPEFRKWLDDEFPERASLPDVNRRTILKLMGASMALAGLSGCRSVFMPQQKIVPYVKAPEDLVPGKPLYFATSATYGGYGVGMLVESREGRPVKIDGNPQHPANLGSSNIFMQAAMLDLFDPDRSSTVRNLNNISTWADFTTAFNTSLERHRKTGGAGLAILTESIGSPTTKRMISQLKRVYPKVAIHQWEPINRDSALTGAKLAFGGAAETTYRFDKAKVVLSLDSDFLVELPGSVRYARDFATTRVPDAAMSRLYAIESTTTLVGAAADHRLPVKAQDIELIAAQIATMLGVSVGSLPVSVGSAAPQNWLQSLVKDLQSHRGEGIVIPGEQQPPSVHALCHAINAALGNIGQTVELRAPVLMEETSHLESIKALSDSMRNGQVSTLLIMGSNPVYSVPKDIRFAESMASVPLTIHLGLYNDETGSMCTWHLPQNHFLESWGDSMAFDGTAAIQQPLISPLYDGKSCDELLAMATAQVSTDYDLVRETWMSKGWTETEWRSTLDSGVVTNSENPMVGASMNPSFPGNMTPGRRDTGLEVIFKPDYNVWDGRYANNGWLRELPRPHTTISWENAAIISPALAQKLGVRDEDRVTISYSGIQQTVPVTVMPGQPTDSVTLHLGYGRTKGGRVATEPNGWGFDVYPMRSSQSQWFGGGISITKAGGDHALAFTQIHNSMEGRDIVRFGTLAELTKNPSLKPEDAPKESDLSVYPDQIIEPTDYQWGMSIDLNLCIGCNACVAACQSENNIPVVGKDQVKNGREMHWIRIDRYYGPRGGAQNLDNPSVHYMPVTCMQCELAPCEPVCPVAATVHSHEGLNQMVYNRCVGTRYCSNNCPYKVRRFNFLNYTDNQLQFARQQDRPLLKMLNNANVTVRGRGVMEKCTYCVQRISAARIESKKRGVPIADGEVITACQQACPTRAISFGNIADPASAVSKQKSNPRKYALLDDLNTRPRTTYLGKVRNPNEELEA